jgi:hypothetical protein
MTTMSRVPAKVSRWGEGTIVQASLLFVQWLLLFFFLICVDPHVTSIGRAGSVRAPLAYYWVQRGCLDMFLASIAAAIASVTLLLLTEKSITGGVAWRVLVNIVLLAAGFLAQLALTVVVLLIEAPMD